MNEYLKKFFHRGLVFGGFGPIIMAIIYLCISFSSIPVVIDGREVFTAILSTYLLAFVHAGVSVFNQIESWPIAKSLLCHLGVLYFSYVGCYLLNSWIPFDFKVVIIFTVVFIVVYFAVWLTVFAIVKSTEKKLNKKL